MRWLIVALLSAVGILVVSALQTPWLTRELCRRALAGQPGVVVKELRIGQQHFSLPGRLEFQDVRLGLEINAKSLTLDIPEILVTGLQSVWAGERRILLSAAHVHGRYDVGEAVDAGLQFTFVGEGVSGPVTVAALSWDKLHAREVAAFLIFNRSGIEVHAVKMKAYAGGVTGQSVVRLRPLLTYTAEVFIEACDVAQLSDINRDLADQLNGAVTGTVKLAGDAVVLKTLDADLTMPAGGRVSASLLAALTQYLPQSREKKRLDFLIRNGGKLAMELFSFTMKGVGQGKFSGELHLRSREINLELNLTHEINTDGTLASLAAYGQKFLK